MAEKLKCGKCNERDSVARGLCSRCYYYDRREQAKTKLGTRMITSVPEHVSADSLKQVTQDERQWGMRIEFKDGNVLGIRGNRHFFSRVLALLAPVITAYNNVAELNSEPVDHQRLGVELQMAAEAEQAKTPFQGRYVTYVPDEPLVDVLPPVEFEQ